MAKESINGRYIPPSMTEKSGFVKFVENTNNITNLAFLNMLLSGANFYKDAQIPGAMEKMATDVDPFFELTIFFLFVAAGSSIIARYEKTKEK